MNTPGEQFIVSIKNDLREFHLDGAMIDSTGAVGIAGLERVISLKAKLGDPKTPQARIDHASAVLSNVDTERPEEHHVVDGESGLSRMVDDFMATQRALGAEVSFDIPDGSISRIPSIASKFGIVDTDTLPGQYL